MNNELSGEIVDAAYKVHTNLGPGLLEHVYQVCLKYELEKKGLDVRSEVEMPVLYDSKLFDVGYRVDLLVESEIIIELKAVTQINSVHRAQILTYLKLARKRLGLLINFNSSLIKNGIFRIAN